MPIGAFKDILAFKVETTAGTAETLTATEVIRVTNLQPSVDPDVLERRYTDDVWTRNPHLLVGKKGSITFDVDIIGNGVTETPGAAPWAELLTACGMKATGLAYAFVQTVADWKTATIGWQHENAVLSLAGCMGSFVLSHESLQAGKCSLTMQGIWQAPVAQAGIFAAADDILPPLTSVATYAGAARKVNRWSVDAGLNIALLKDTSAAGYYRGWLSGRSITAQLDPEQVAGVDLWTDYYNATERALSIVMGTAAGNKLTIAAGATQITSMSDGTRDGVRIHDINLAANGTSPLTLTWA